MWTGFAWLIVAMSVALGTGLYVGTALARRGVTADNALAGRQRQALVVIAAACAAAAVLYWGTDQPWVPTFLLFWGEVTVGPGTRMIAAFGLGLVIGLEWPGRHEKKRRSNLVYGGAALVLLTGFLLHRSVPIGGMLLAPAMADGIVMQTTSHTCAPAAIATLARVTGADTGMTERDAVELTRTTREGTTTQAQMRALRALGFHPVFRRNLPPESLGVLGPSVLHVDEPVLTTTIRHAVALLAVDTTARTITIGNPLHGRQAMRFDELRGYWIGEAVTLGPRGVP